MNPTPVFPLRVLIADDDAEVRRSLALLLEHQGCHCVEAADCTAVMAAVATNVFNVLICDIHMPDNEQLELVRRLAETVPELPVILVTGRPEVTTAMAAVSLPVVAYLAKPLKFADIWAAIEVADCRVKESRQVRELKTVVRESIDVLERTRQNFKSRQLADLRRRLEQSSSGP